MLRRTSSRASSRYSKFGARRGLDVLAAAPNAPAATTSTRTRTIQPPTPTESARLARRLAEVSAAALMIQPVTRTPAARYTTFNAMWSGHAHTSSASGSGVRRTQRRSHSTSHSPRGALRPTSSLQSPRRTADTASAAPSLADEIPTSPYRCTIDQVLPPPSNMTGFRVPSDVDDEPSNEHLRALVELLVDPDAVGIEDVRLVDFASMTARRQLRALGNDKECLEVVLGSEQYHACRDSRALRLAGVTTVGDWHERADRVPISAYSRGVLEQAYQRIIHRQQPAGSGSGGQDTEVIAWLTRTIQKAVAAELVAGTSPGLGGTPLLQATTAPASAVSTADHPQEVVVKSEEEDVMELEDNGDGTVDITESIHVRTPQKTYQYTTTTHAPEEMELLAEDDVEQPDDVPRWNGDIDVTGMQPVSKKTKKTPPPPPPPKQQTRMEEETDEPAVPVDAEDEELDAEIERLLRETEEESAPPRYVRGAEQNKSAAPKTRAGKSTTKSSRAPRAPAVVEEVEAPMAEEEAETEEIEEIEEIEEVEEVVEEGEEEGSHGHAARTSSPATGHKSAATAPSTPATASGTALSPAKEARLVRLAELMLTQVNSADGYLHMPLADLKSDLKEGAVEEVADEVCQVSPLTLFSAYHAAPIDAETADGRFPPEVVALKRIWDHYNRHQTALEEAESSADAVAAEFHTVKSVEALVQGALWLRCISREEAISLDVQTSLPAYGFPLLSSDVRAFDAKRPRSSPYTNVNAQDVLDAAEAYKAFFRQKKELRFTPFRSTIDQNAGCNVVMLAGSTLHLYETSLKSEIQEDQVRLPFAEAMLGVLHILRDCHVLPRGVNTVHYHILVTQLPSVANTDTDMMLSGTTIVSVDLTGPFTSAEKKRLMALAEPLGMSAEMEEFECVEDIVRQVRETTNVNVIHDLLQNRDELEAMLTPTLVQLLPEDADSAAEVDDAQADEAAEEETVPVAEDEEGAEVEEVEEVVEVEEIEEEVPPPAPPVTSARRRTAAQASASAAPTPAAAAHATRRPARKVSPPPPPQPQVEEEVEEVEEVPEEVEEIIEVEEEEEEVVAPPPPPPAARRRVVPPPASRASTKRTSAPTTSRWNLEEDTELEVADEEEEPPRVMTRTARAPHTAPKAAQANVSVTARRAPPPVVEEAEDVDVQADPAPPQQWFNRKMKAKRRPVK